MAAKLVCKIYFILRFAESPARQRHLKKWKKDSAFFLLGFAESPPLGKQLLCREPCSRQRTRLCRAPRAWLSAKCKVTLCREPCSRQRSRLCREPCSSGSRQTFSSRQRLQRAFFKFCFDSSYYSQIKHILTINRYNTSNSNCKTNMSITYINKVYHNIHTMSITLSQNITKYLKVSQHPQVHCYRASQFAPPGGGCCDGGVAAAAAATEAHVVDTHTPTHSTVAEAVEVVDLLTLRTEAPHSNPPIEPAQRRRKISTYTKA